MAASWTAFPNLVLCKLKQNVHLQLLGWGQRKRYGAGGFWALEPCVLKSTLFGWYFSNTREAFKELRKSENVKSSGK